MHPIQKASFTLIAWIPAIFACSNHAELWIDCHPDSGASQQRCENRGCVWSPKPTSGAPSCTFNEDPSKSAGYNAIRTSTTNETTLYSANLERRNTTSLFSEDYQNAKITVELISNEIMRVKIVDEGETARPAKYPLWRENVREYGIDQNASTVSSTLDVHVDENPFGLAVTRKSTNLTLLDTRGIPGFTFALQYLQISTRVPTQYVYGLGETTHEQFKHQFDYRKWGLFARDKLPGMDDTNLYGIHAFYLCVEDDTGNAHGVFFLNTHALNVALQPDPSNPEGGIITWRTIGGMFEFFIFSGPTPDRVISQYTSLIGRPQLPPYWALGFQLSRWGYKNLTMLEETYDRNHLAGIPQDAQVIDIDYMEKWMDFTYDPDAFANLTGFVKKLHQQNVKLILILDPAIPSRPSIAYHPLEEGNKNGVFIKDNQTGKPLEGKVWPGFTYFPDFDKPQTMEWWKSMITQLHENGTKFDGLWIDMNEPANFLNGSVTGCSQNSYNYPPYNPLIYDPIFELTVCLDADHHDGKHYEFHNLYGYSEAVATYQALKAVFPGKRPFILSRSTFAGSGKYTNHWTGDVSSRWSHLKMSIVTMLEFNMFGIPFVGADICGFAETATEEMCIRWSQLGAFYPFSRNHNVQDVPDQDPASWSPMATGIIRDILFQRYLFLPYLYSLLYQSHLSGTPVARPIFFDAPQDKQARLVDDQFMWGSGLMIAPVVEEGKTQRTVYFPQGLWYDLLHNKPISDSPQSLLIDMPLNMVGLYLRAGQIVPTQAPGVNTVQSRRNDIGLYVGLDDQHQANGFMYWDDGESYNGTYSLFSMTAWDEGERGGLRIRLDVQEYVADVWLNEVWIYGMKGKPESVTLVGVQFSQILLIDWNESAHVLNLRSFRTKLDLWHEVVWEFPKAPTTGEPANTTTTNAGSNVAVGSVISICWIILISMLQGFV